MVNSYIRQVVDHAKSRPSYPTKLFRFIIQKTPEHELAWDVGTGNGQAAQSLAQHYKKIIATDTSQPQLDLAPKLPNVRYERTSAIMSKDELRQKVASESSVDLVAVAQAIHWFDIPRFYEQAKWVLKKPHGVIAAWCYTPPEVNPAVDTVLRRFHEHPYWRPEAKLLWGNKYFNLEFPFQPMDGLEVTGPFRFENERSMSLDDYFAYIRSQCGYQNAIDQNVELLSREEIQEFTRAWRSDGNSGSKSVNFPLYLRLGRVGCDV